MQPPSLLERFYSKFSRAPAPSEARQLQSLSRFSQPELVQFTKVGRGDGDNWVTNAMDYRQQLNNQADTFKRSAQVEGYSYPAPAKQLSLPEKQQEAAEEDSEEVEVARSTLQAQESGTSFLRAAPLQLTTPSGEANLRIIQVPISAEM